MNNIDVLLRNPDKNIDAFGQQIRRWRRLCNLTQEGFADYVGLARTTILAIEKKNNICDLSLDELYRLYYYFTKSRERIDDTFYDNIIKNIVIDIDEELFKRMKIRIEDRHKKTNNDLTNIGIAMDEICVCTFSEVNASDNDVIKMRG